MRDDRSAWHHSMRKTFANKLYAALQRGLVKTQRPLGHRSINSPVHYLSLREEEIDAAILVSEQGAFLNELSMVEEAAARLKISGRTLREWLSTGKLRGVNTGKY